MTSPTSFLFASLVVTLLLGSVATAQSSRDAAVDVWFGTTTSRDGLSKGIYHARFDTQSGKLAEPTLAAEVSSPGFLTQHPRLPILYSVGSWEGEPSVVAYRIDENDGSQLTPIHAQPIGDGGAAHLTVDRSGSVLLSAQYGGGSTALFPLNEQGEIQPRAQLVKHRGGSGVVDRRQDAPHAHWVGTSPDNRFVFVPDLGLDQVVIYRLDLNVDPPQLHAHGAGQCPPGSGPRHMKFHPDGNFVYVLNELALSVTVFRYDAEAGSMQPIQTIETLSEAQKAAEAFNSASEIRVHPSGKFLYTANRGHDSITAFAVDPESGRLGLLEQEPIRGGWPRNFALDPSGRWLIAAGRDSHTAAVFAIDPNSGHLTYTRQMAMVPSPICVLFARPE